jgi:hypothetical protein
VAASKICVTSPAIRWRTLVRICLVVARSGALSQTYLLNDHYSDSLLKTRVCGDTFGFVNSSKKVFTIHIELQEKHDG